MKSALTLIAEGEANSKWISDNSEKLKAKYNNQWVAVLKKKVVDHDTDFEKLIKRLRAGYPNEYVEIHVEYITTEEPNFLL